MAKLSLNPTVPSVPAKTADTQKIYRSPSEYARVHRLLDTYLRTSIEDERMNRKREYWLWERKSNNQSKQQKEKQL